MGADGTIRAFCSFFIEKTQIPLEKVKSFSLLCADMVIFAPAPNHL